MEKQSHARKCGVKLLIPVTSSDIYNWVTTHPCCILRLIHVIKRVSVEFILGNTKIICYLFLSFPTADMMQVVIILPRRRHIPIYPIKSIPWPLMPWWHMSPGHQQPWYWPSNIMASASEMLSPQLSHLSLLATPPNECTQTLCMPDTTSQPLVPLMFADAATGSYYSGSHFWLMWAKQFLSTWQLRRLRLSLIRFL